MTVEVKRPFQVTIVTLTGAMYLYDYMFYKDALTAQNYFISKIEDSNCKGLFLTNPQPYKQDAGSQIYIPIHNVAVISLIDVRHDQ